MGLVFALAVPQLQNARAGAELRAAVRDVASGLREARSRAIAMAQPDAFTVDSKHSAFQIGVGDKWHQLPGAIHPSVFNPQDEPPAQDIGEIRFFPDGSSTGGGVRLSLRNARYDVLVDWLTGRVAIRDVASNSRAEGRGVLTN